MFKLSAEELMEAHILKFGPKHVQRVWSIYAKLEPFVEAMRTEIGQQMYNGVLEKMGQAKAAYEDRLLNAEDPEKPDKQTLHALLRYRTLGEVVDMYNDKMAKYLKLTELSEEAENEYIKQKG